MKLFHGTSKENAELILANGLEMADNDSSNCDREIKGACIYGFDNFEDAENFAIDQCYDEIAVVSFEAEDVNLDPEYLDAEFQEGKAYYTTQEVDGIELV